MAKLKLTINSRLREVDVDPETPLLWVLRDAIGLTGTKYSCGIGVCGSCTVLINGESARSCTLSAADAQGKSVVTIEGVAEDANNPIIRAWLEEEVSQCGYCQPGQILTAAAFLKKNRRPTDAQIDAAMKDTLCRCGTYPRIRRAIHRVAKEGGVK
ncbi:MAG: (2Fe-2S)-binding protein [Ignavibacteria bacterium]|nr:(2Fe-2S)-binding protein [Ignavibacteria bacterium]